MLAKKDTSPSPNHGLRKELDYLHARKSALDALIQSLEDYDRFRSKPSTVPKLKTA
jgi:hypothetical protein